MRHAAIAAAQFYAIYEGKGLKKFLIGLVVVVVLIASVPLFLLATGTIDSTSLRMVMNVMTGMGGPATSAASVQQRYRVPEGFTLQLYASDLPRARFLRFTPGGDLLVSRPHSGDIVLLRRDADGDGHPDAVETLIEGLRRPLGMDFEGDWLYIAESNRIGRVPFDSASGTLSGDYQPLIEGLTDNGNHWSKTIRIGADKRLYLAQGSTCNICTEEDDRRASMTRFQLDGSEPETLATGLRNSVGFDWAPWSGELYATDNGRDLLGDDFPPCELNRIEQDHFYGWPYFNGDNIPDPDMGADPLSAQRKPTAPAHDFRAHNAPLGMTFLAPEHWSDDGLNNGIEERDFLTGFNRDGDIRGRPVDVAQGPDGAIYISDDYAGAIYRVSYNQGGESSSPVLAIPAVDRLDAQAPSWLAEADLEAMTNRGGELYQRYECRNCHEQGENPKLLAGLSERLGYNAVIEVLKAPQSPMPIYPLSDIEQRELAVFLLRPPHEDVNTIK
jgi:glucose/arabinose dehydrogenase